MRFKIGTRVRVRPDLADFLHKKCGNESVTESMLKYAGKLVRVVRITQSFDYEYYYIKNSQFLWTDEMLIRHIPRKRKGV